MLKCLQSSTLYNLPTYFLKLQLHKWIYLKKQLYGPFLRMGFNCLKLVPLRGGSLLFTTKFPDIPDTNFIDLGRMKGWVDLGATKWFWTRDTWTGNLAPLTTRPLLRYPLPLPLHFPVTVERSRIERKHGLKKKTRVKAPWKFSVVFIIFPF